MYLIPELLEISGSTMSNTVASSRTQKRQTFTFNLGQNGYQYPLRDNILLWQ